MISYTVQVYIMTIITILRQQHAKIMKEHTMNFGLLVQPQN